MTDFTPKQLAAWRRYEGVRVSSEFNMITDGSRAGEAARLNRDEYLFCLSNYSALRRATENLDGKRRAQRTKK